MQEHDVYNLVFSSSSKVYGIPQYLPLDEQHPVGKCTNPYGKTKYMVEQVLQDLCSVSEVGNYSDITPDVTLLTTKKYWHFSYFSTKTYVFMKK